MRLPSIIILALASIVLMSCGGGGDKTARSESSPTAAAERPRLISLAGALREASDAAVEVQTLTAAFQIVIDSRAGAEYFSGRIQLDGPDRMYMVMEHQGESLEILAVMPDMFVRYQNADWARIDIPAPSVDPETFVEYHEDRGIIDLDYLAGYIEDNQRLADDAIDGRTFEHYWGGFDYADVISGIDEEVILSCPGLASLANSTGDVRVEAWIDPETRLPRRLTVDMDINVPALNNYIGIKTTTEFLEYNGPVSIPEPPAAAPLLSDVQRA